MFLIFHIIVFKFYLSILQPPLECIHFDQLLRCVIFNITQITISFRCLQVPLWLYLLQCQTSLHRNKRLFEFSYISHQVDNILIDGECSHDKDSQISCRQFIFTIFHCKYSYKQGWDQNNQAIVGNLHLKPILKSLTQKGIFEIFILSFQELLGELPLLVETTKSDLPIQRL